LGRGQQIEVEWTAGAEPGALATHHAWAVDASGSVSVLACPTI